ncbi:MAG: 2-oxoglutarate dehydrogenase complex dihydrolipoyllysine-residue succinyltransferase [Chitinophagaceae bacterium]
MAIEIKVPSVGESIQEVTLAKWLRKEGEWVERDEVIAELESEKASFEVNAEQAGAVQLIAKEGDSLAIGDLICRIDTEAKRPETIPVQSTANTAKSTAQPTAAVQSEHHASPVAAAIIAEKKLDISTLTPSGTNGKIMKQDVLDALNHPGTQPGLTLFGRNERTEKMSVLRKTLSRRLVESKNTTAMLTTFNEVDMSAIMEIRTKYKDKFKEAHAVNLGFMSFFTKACSFALLEWPSVNASLDGDQVKYHDYCDISIAVSAPRGLVVPVIRNAESLSMAGIELQVAAVAAKARDNKLTIEEMAGGTFTITNGGVFGSLMSTPIINIPQSAILGMHKIQDRPMAINGQVVIRPMMYLALSYDHRIIDGRESVGFLVRVKELLENPALMLFGKDPVRSLLEL